MTAPKELVSTRKQAERIEYAEWYKTYEDGKHQIYWGDLFSSVACVINQDRSALLDAVIRIITIDSTSQEEAVRKIEGLRPK